MIGLKRLALFPLLFGLLLILALPVGAAEEDAAGEPASAAATVPEAMESPRATMAAFLRAMNDIKRGRPDRIDDAITTLDLSAVNPLVQHERGRDLAWILLEVMDRTRVVNLKRIPDRAAGKPYLFERFPAGPVRIARQDDGRWLFAADTLAALPDILDGLAGKARVKPEVGGAEYLPWHLRFREGLAPEFKRRGFLLENWQWLGILVLITVGVVIDKLLAVLLRLGVRRWRERTAKTAFHELSDGILRPFALMFAAILWWLGLNLLALPEDALLVLLVGVKFLAGGAGVWAAYRLVDLLSAYMADRASRTESRLDDALVPLFTRTFKLFVTVVGVVFVADNLNVDVTSLLAGLGLGGLAFALAAKDVVQNLFGSLTVLLDKTFSVGDWVVVGDTEGTVERIGFRSTRIRTFYNSLVSVPNSQLITANVDNLGERHYRRLKCKLSLTYDTSPDKIEAFCEGVRELVRLHPYMRKDYFHVYFNEYAAASLDVLVYVFWQTPDWSTELRERHRLLLDILRVAKRLGVEFAYPTQTIYWRQEPAGEAAEVPVELSQEAAFEAARREARAVVEGTIGLGNRPPPVSFP